LRVYALPRNAESVSVFEELDAVLVDLRAEMPSYCLRPHVQEGGFLARKGAAYSDIMRQPMIEETAAALDELCIAHIHLDIDGGRKRFYWPRHVAGALYPKASTSCQECDRSKVPKKDLNGDYILHLLTCLAAKDREHLFEPGRAFPDHYADKTIAPANPACGNLGVRVQTFLKTQRDRK
jgi:hypothetical protein